MTHLGNIKRKYKVTGVTKESANEKTFTMEKDGADVDVTVAAYFEERYKVKLRCVSCVLCIFVSVKLKYGRVSLLASHFAPFDNLPCSEICFEIILERQKEE